MSLVATKMSSSHPGNDGSNSNAALVEGDAGYEGKERRRGLVTHGAGELDVGEKEGGR